MSNECSIQNYSLGTCINQGYALYNRYADVFLNPDVRKEVVQRANLPNFLMYIYELRRQMLNSGERIVTTRKYLWEEVNDASNPYNFQIKAMNAVGQAGAKVTATIKKPFSAEGYTSPQTGYTATTTVNGTFVEVQVGTVSGDKIDLHPINGQTLDFTGKDYIFAFNPTVTYQKSCSGTISKFGLAQSQPEIGTGVIQAYEKGICICQDALTHYGYDEIPDKMQMQDPLTGQFVDTFCLPSFVMDNIAKEMFYGQFYEMMFGQYNHMTDTGIQGLLPTIQSRGGFNMPIKASDPSSLFASLKYLVNFYKKKGIRKFTLWCDSIMYTNIIESIAKHVGKNNFGLPVWQGSQEELNWYNFKSINQIFGLDVDIRINTLNGWEEMGYDGMLRSFAILLPDTPYTTSTGVKVPQLELVKLKGCDGYQVGQKNGAGVSVWYDDTRQRGGRTFDVYARNEFGLDIHGVKFMGLLTDVTC